MGRPGGYIIDRRAKHHQHLTSPRGLAEEEVQNFEERWRCFCCIIMTAPLELEKEEEQQTRDLLCVRTVPQLTFVYRGGRRLRRQEDVEERLSSLDLMSLSAYTVSVSTNKYKWE